MHSELPDCQLSEFRDFEEIGCGGEGFVTKAYHSRFGYVAVKRFLRKNALAEIDLLIKCPKHPNLVQLFARIPDPTFHGKYLGYVVEYVKGGSLDKVIFNPEKSYDCSQMYQWIEQIGLGLQHLHRERIIHRDVKPSNILVTTEHLKLTDFGIAKCMKETLASNTVSVGTYAYMAPEVIIGSCYDFSADIYSYTITIWEIINRQIAYSHITKTQLEAIIDGTQRPSLNLNEVNQELCQLIERGWDSDPARRPSLEEIIHHVHKIGSGKCGNSELSSEMEDKRKDDNFFGLVFGKNEHHVMPGNGSIMGMGTNPGVNVTKERVPTHISNASIHGIWTLVVSDRKESLKAAENLSTTCKNLEFGVSKEVQIEVEHVAALNGFTQILPGNVIPFWPDGDTYTVYITIFYQDRIVDGPAGHPTLLCSAYPMPRGHNVTVTPQNQVQPVPYSVW